MPSAQTPTGLRADETPIDGNMGIGYGLCSPSRDVLDQSRCLLLEAVARVEKSGKSIAEQVERLAQRHREQELEFRSTIETHKQAQQEAVKRAEMERARNQLLTRQLEQAELNQQIRDPYQSAGRTPGQR